MLLYKEGFVSSRDPPNNLQNIFVLVCVLHVIRALGSLIAWSTNVHKISVNIIGLQLEPLIYEFRSDLILQKALELSWQSFIPRRSRYPLAGPEIAS